MQELLVRRGEKKKTSLSSAVDIVGVAVTATLPRYDANEPLLLNSECSAFECSIAVTPSGESSIRLTPSQEENQCVSSPKAFRFMREPHLPKYGCDDLVIRVGAAEYSECV